MNSLKFTLLLLVVSLTTTVSFSQEQASNSELGMFAFEEETIDYGTVVQHDNGTRVFKFKNSGKAPIVISDVKTSCGCTVPTYSKKPILPGESGTIEVKYATNKLGKFSKSVTVLSNAQETRKLLRIKGNVVKNGSKTIK